MCQSAEHEHFVHADDAAAFLSISRKYLLKLSRLHIVPAHPIGIGSRRQWRYRISELAEWALAQCAIRPDNKGGSPRSRERK
jgi:Helix-turn-helix domain